MFDEEEGDKLNANRKLSIYKHIKKKAANDAQLLMNRIALIQKEEERARKKIDQTKDRALDILSLRQENERRVESFASASGEVNKVQQVLLSKNREHEVEGKEQRKQRLEVIKNKKKEEVGEMLMEKKYLTQLMIQEQEKAIQAKQRKRDEVRRMEEAIKLKKEEERREKERKMKEYYEKKIEEEAEEARRAEKLVKALERKEREWIEKLRETQLLQENAFEQLEHALMRQDLAIPAGAGASPQSRPAAKAGAGSANVRASSAPKKRPAAANGASKKGGH